jgi:hypothetical protein
MGGTIMAQAQPFDPVEFKRKTRQEWHDAAAGWRKWAQNASWEPGSHEDQGFEGASGEQSV